MPRQNGKYVVPTGGWVNGAAPYLNASEMNAISETLALLGIANGGTGATTAPQALTNLGAEPLVNVAGKGTQTNPVYFNEQGVAIPIPTATRDASAVQNGLEGVVYRYGRVCVYNFTWTATGTGRLVYNDDVNQPFDVGFRPTFQTYGMAFGLLSNNNGSNADTTALVSINTSGRIRFAEVGSSFPTTSRTRYFKGTVVYIAT